MFKTNYYCLVAGLPDLLLNDDRYALTSLQFRLDMAKELTPSDYQLLEWIYRPFDNSNLLNLLLENGAEFDPLGNYPEDYLREQIAAPTTIADDMKALITGFRSGQFGSSPFQLEKLQQEFFYESVLRANDAFIVQWFTFDRGIKNILTAVNCRKFGYPATHQLIVSGSSDDLHQILLNGNIRPELFIDEDIPYVDQIFRIAESGVQASEKEKAIDYIKFTFSDDLTVFSYFTADVIFSFAVKLLIIDRWRKLDDKAGKAFLNRLVEQLEMSYSFADTFSLTQKR